MNPQFFFFLFAFLVILYICNIIKQNNEADIQSPGQVCTPSSGSDSQATNQLEQKKDFDEKNFRDDFIFKLTKRGLTVESENEFWKASLFELDIGCAILQESKNILEPTQLIKLCVCFRQFAIAVEIY